MKRTERHHLKENQLRTFAQRAAETVESRRNETTTLVLIAIAVAVVAIAFFAWRENVQGKAHALESMDLQPGDRVATLLRNSREAVEALIACQKHGYEIAPLNTWAKPKELRTILERSDPAALIFDPKHADQVREATAKDRTITVSRLK